MLLSLYAASLEPKMTSNKNQFNSVCIYQTGDLGIATETVVL
jgi:hypothetical protein